WGRREQHPAPRLSLHQSRARHRRAPRTVFFSFILLTWIGISPDMKRTASGAHWISGRRERHARPPSAQAEHQWSGEDGRRVFEERKIETRSDDLEIALREGVAISERGRSNRDRATRSVLAMPGREQSDGALMTRVRTGFVNAFVQLGCDGENQRQKKSTDKS